MIIIEQERFITNEDEFKIIEEKFNIEIPQSLKAFLLKYEGAFVKDTYYKSEPTFKEILILEKRERYASIESILEGHETYHIFGFIPFAIDSGGWDYNVSVNEDTFRQVWVNKFDSGEENPMEFLASSFDEFVNNLNSAN